MSKPVSDIPNIGAAGVASFARAGIHTAEDVRRLGADEAYTALIAAGERPHFIGYYALVMGLQGRPWNDCKGAEKTALRERFDQIVANANAAPDQSAIDRALAEIGIVPKSDDAT